jgi:hypothetical protein
LEILKPPVELDQRSGSLFFGYTFSMPQGPDNKSIRSLKDNPAGKVVADAEGNRWEWQSADETAHLLKQLNNDELAIEKTDIHPTPKRLGLGTAAAKPTAAKPVTGPSKPGVRDKGGGFNPYDHAGKPRRR